MLNNANSIYERSEDMSYSTIKVENQPIVISTLHKDYDLATEITYSNQAAIEVLSDASEDQLFLIVHFEVQLTMNDILLGASAVTRGENALWLHEKVRQVLVVTKDLATSLSAQGMRHELFGNVNVEVFETLEQALSFAQS